MDSVKANQIYQHPNRHTKEELHECLRVLHENYPQPIELGYYQFEAIKDAIMRLKSWNKGK